MAEWGAHWRRYSGRRLEIVYPLHIRLLLQMQVRTVKEWVMMTEMISVVAAFGSAGIHAVNETQ